MTAEELLTKIIDLLAGHQYLAMFGILVLCGLGLPIPEEVTLIGSGLLVGLGKADFTLATATCVAGILAGDSIIFGAGYLFGSRFLRSRPMRFLLSLKRQRRVRRFFEKHGNKAVFFARFFAGVRIGVYAYAGSQRMSWWRFLLLDFIGAVLSGSLSIWAGKWAAETFKEDIVQAQGKAFELAHKFSYFLLGAIAAALLVYLVLRLRRKRPTTDGADLPEPMPPRCSQPLAGAPSVPAAEDSSSATVEAQAPPSPTSPGRR